MRFFNSIRWQLQVWHGLLLLGVLCAFGFTAYQLEKTERLQRVDADLQRVLSLLVSTLRERPSGQQSDPPRLDEQRVQKLVAASVVSDQIGPQTGFYYVIWMRGPGPVARSANAPAQVPRPGEHEPAVRLRTGQLRESFIFAAPVDCVLVGTSIKEAESGFSGHIVLLAAAGLVLLALSQLVGWILTARALRPIRNISEAAGEIAGGDLARRIDISQTESELGELAAVLNATFSRLDTAFAQQARFTSDAAHELRTPLTVLLIQTQAALARERSAGEYRDALIANQATAQRMRRLVESLLELARLDAGQEPLRRVPCDLSSIAADCAALLQPLAKERSIDLQLELTESRCCVDVDRMAQAITNLLKNAIDYNRGHGSVRLVTKRQNGAVKLEVADTGNGIGAADLPHIFERFYRADSARGSGGSRAGLGLAISKAIIDAHGGHIEASSDGKTGTAFAVILPSD